MKRGLYMHKLLYLVEDLFVDQQLLGHILTSRTSFWKCIFVESFIYLTMTLLVYKTQFAM